MDDGCSSLIILLFIVVLVIAAVAYGIFAAADRIEQNRTTEAQQATLQERERTLQERERSVQEHEKTLQERDREDAKTERFQSFLVAMKAQTGMSEVMSLIMLLFFAFVFGGIATLAALLWFGRRR